MSSSPQAADDADLPGRTVLGPSRGDVIFMSTIGALAGVLLGWFAPVIAKATRTWEWMPLRGPISMIGGLVDGAGGLIHLGLAIALGVVCAVLALELLDSTRLEIDHRAVTVRGDKKATRCPRAQVAEIEVERRSLGRCILSIRDAEDADLARAELDISADRVRTALEQHEWVVTETRRG